MAMTCVATEQDLINRQGPLKEASIASIAFDMAQGLLYMHSLNMVHRDIKPANILLDREVGLVVGYARECFLLHGTPCCSLPMERSQGWATC